MIFGVLAITGPDSGVVGGPGHVMYLLGQSLGAVLKGGKVNCEITITYLAQKGQRV